MKRYINTAIKVLNSVMRAFDEANRTNTQAYYFTMPGPRLW